MSKCAERFWFLLVILASAGIARGVDQEVLSNGMRVIYAPTPGVPLVHVRVLYHVGSRDERPDRQGFAHMFEHMMFRGSQHVGEQDFVRLIRAAGGEFNGETDQDITSYFQTLPKNQLPLALYLEADRMASFRVTPQGFQIERNVVLEEISLKSEDPFIALRQDLLGEVFQNNSYRWTPLGNPRQLMAADVGELQQFFDRFYVPNNAAMIITGDFDPAEAKRLVHSYFEWIPKGAEIVRNISSEPAPKASRRIEISRAIPNTCLIVGCQTSRYGSDDDAAIMVLEQAIKLRVLQILALQDNQLASSTFTQLFQLEDAGCLSFGAMLLPGADLAKAERILNIRLQFLREDGIVASEAQFKSLTDAIIADLLRRRQTPEGLSDQIGRGVLMRNQPDFSDRLIERLRKLTAPMVRDAAEKYLKPELLTIMIVRPQDKQVDAPILVQSDASQVQSDRPTVVFPKDYPLAAPSAVAMAPAEAKSIEEIHVRGLTAFLSPQIRSENIEFKLLFPRGWQNDPAGKEGLGRLTADMAIGLSGAAASRMAVQQMADRTELTLLFPNADAERLAVEINQALRQPLRPAMDFQLFALKWRIFDDARSRGNQPINIAETEARTALFSGAEVSANSLRAISRDDVDSHRKILFDVQNATAVISGNLTVDRAKSLLEKLLESLSPAPQDASVVTQARQHPRVILIDAPDSHESFIRISSAIVGKQIPNPPVADLAGRILSQRIFNTARAEKGYTYMVDAGFHPLPGGTLFGVQTSTSIARTGATLATVLDNLRELSGNGASAAELADAKSAYIGGMVMHAHSPHQQAEWRAMQLLGGQTFNLTEHLGQINSISTAEIQGLYAQYANPQELLVIIVAPAAAVKTQIEPFGTLEIRPIPSRRPGAATRPAHEEIPRPFM